MKLTRHLQLLGPDPINAHMVVQDEGKNHVMLPLRSIDGTQYEAWFTAIEFATIVATITDENE